MCAFTQRARAAEMAQSDFGRALSGAERRMERAAMELARTRRLLEREDMAGAFGSAFAFSAEVEKLALLARVLPAYTGHPKAAELTEQMLLDTVPIEMGYDQLPPEDKKHPFTAQSETARDYRLTARKLLDQKYTALANLCQE